MYNQFNGFYLPKQEILRVNGEAGANSLNLAPNSSVLALDINDAIVFSSETDCNGQKVVTAFEIKQREPEQPINLKDLASRIAAIERRLSDAKSDTTENEQ